METNNKLAAGILAVTISTLFGCGGGSSTPSSSNTSTGSSPHTLNARELQGVDVLSTNPGIESPTVTSNASSITLTFHTTDFSPGQHAQFFLNVDNNAATGFIFDSEAWDKAGTDYIIEDGHLFKSTASDNSWSWNENVGKVEYSLTGGSTQGSTFSVKINKSLLPELSSVIRAGFIHRDADWNVKAFYPNSTLMQEYRINVTPPAVDTVAPVIKIIGLKTETVLINTQHADRGAYANDNVDGNITARIQTSSDLDISKTGTYHIVYSVSDQAGNTASVTRTVKVVEQISEGIIIDGHDTEWQSIHALSEAPNGVLKVTENNGKIYIVVRDETRPILDNTQIFIDVDSDSSTGFQFNGDIWNQGGADYMVENDHLDKAKSNSSSWAWDYNVTPIEIVKSGNILEMAIPKSALDNLGSTMTIGYVYRDKNWSVNNVVPGSGMVSYTLSTTPPIDTIPASVKHALCDNPDTRSFQTPPEGSLLDGYLYQGVNYQAKKETGNNYSFWTEENGITKQIGSFVSDYEPTLYSISDALYIKTGLRKRGGPRTIWRASANALVEVTNYSSAHGPNINMIAAIGSNTDYFWITRPNPQGAGTTFISYKKPDETSYTTLLSKLNFPPYLQMHYENGKLYVANTENNVRSISLINDSTKTLEKIGSCN